MKKYGFLGLGIMGRAMAANLVNAGLDVTVWNRTAERCKVLVDMGARQEKYPSAVVEACDITFAMVSDPTAARELCQGRNGVLAGMKPGKGYIDVSTVDPATSIEISHSISKKGGRFLEAPVSGSKKPAEDGALVFLCGGDESLFQEAGSALEVMGKKTFYFGETGKGAKMKLVINMVMGTMMTAFSEGLALGKKTGLAATDILKVLEEGVIANQMFRIKGPLMIDEKFPAAFPLKHMQKDLRLALLLGDEIGQSLHISGSANNSYIKARNQGYGDNDFSSVLRVIGE